MLGVDDEDFRRIARHPTFFAFVPPDPEEPVVLQLALRKTAPGHERADTSIDLPQLDREPPTVDVGLRRRADEWCRVLVRVEWKKGDSETLSAAPEGTPRVEALVGARNVPPLTVHMKGALSQASYGFAVWLLKPPLQELGQAPSGEYTVWWSTHCRWTRPLPQTLRLEGDEVTLLLDASQLG